MSFTYLVVVADIGGLLVLTFASPTSSPESAGVAASVPAFKHLVSSRWQHHQHPLLRNL